MYEKRMTQRLTQYWERLKKDDPIPPFQAFNPSAIDDVWDYCMLLAVNDNAAKASYSYYRMGNKVKSLYGSDVSGQAFQPGSKAVPAAKIVKRVEEMLHHPEPIYDNGQFVGGNNKIVKFRSCMLPFGNDDHITHIIVGLSWREFG